ncbi:MAG TPA: MerR family transcriptional regulator [Diaminobutyricibacter sp.]|uniref:MerR family transcriptional regulator n=1 Tax=Leifsonia sp. McL0618 TaxID=3415677 RepID=UPI00338715E0
MKIGEVARGAGVSTKTVRYYESLGLFTVRRLSNGYRDYDESHIELVREIQSLRTLGIGAEQTRPFLDCLVAGNERADDCAESVAAYRATISSLDGRIAELQARRRALADVIADASTRARPLCEFAAVGAAPVTIPDIQSDRKEEH